VIAPGRLAIALLWLAGCGTAAVAPPPTCALDFAAPLPAAPGDTVTLLGGPVTDPEDTTVLVGGTSATLVDVSRDECTLCDACESAANCTGCDDCLVCKDSCDTCVQRVSFVVPEVTPGNQSLVVINSWGSSTDLVLAVAAPPADTDTTDSDTP
jgi:hypothetical protein